MLGLEKHLLEWWTGGPLFQLGLLLDFPGGPPFVLFERWGLLVLVRRHDLINGAKLPLGAQAGSPANVRNPRLSAFQGKPAPEMPRNSFLRQRTCWSCDTNLFALSSHARSVACGKRTEN